MFIKQVNVQASMLSTPLGSMMAVADDQAVLYLQFVDPNQLESQIDRLQKLFKVSISMLGNAVLAQLRHELDQYFAGNLQSFSVPIKVDGTEFQSKVWSALQAIEYGTVRSYQDVAQAVHSDKAVRAVGSANRVNRCAILIPCHRVIAKTGKFGGYAGGVDRKIWLLAHEQKMVKNQQRAAFGVKR